MSELTNMEIDRLKTHSDKLNCTKFYQIVIFITGIIWGYLNDLQAQELNLTKQNFSIRIEADSVIVYRKCDCFNAVVRVTSQHQVRLNKTLYDSNHFDSDGIYYELEGLNNGRFVPYPEIEGAYGMDVQYSSLTGYYTNFSKEFFFDCNPFCIHTPLCNSVYRLRVILRENKKIICSSPWHCMYIVRRKNQLNKLHRKRYESIKE